MDDFQTLNNDAKRKYSYVTRHSLPDISSSPSSYSSHSSSSNNGLESAYLLPVDEQLSLHQSPFYAADPSTLNSLIDMQVPSTTDVDNSQAILKSNVNSNIQHTSSHVHSNINNNIQQHVIFSGSGHPHEVSTINQNDFDIITQPKSLPSEKSFERKEIDLHQKDFAGSNDLVVTSGTLLEIKSSEHNSGTKKMRCFTDAED